MIQLAETTPPAGIANWGQLWFDSTAHVAKYIDNNGSAVTLGNGQPNLFTQDSTGSDPADTLEQMNGGNSQTLRIYHSYTNSTNYSRMQFTWDSSQGAWQIGSTFGSGGGAAGGVEVATGSMPTPRWTFGAGSPYAFYPNADNTYTIGTPTYSAATIYGHQFCIGGSCITSWPGGGGAVASVFGRTGAVVAASGDYSVAQVSGAAPLASPTFSGVITQPDGTMISTSGWAGSPTFLNNVTINGNLNVAGNINQTSNSPTMWSGKEWMGTTASVPSGMDFSLGVGSDGTFHCQLASGGSCMPSGGGAVTSVFGRTGVVTAQSGDYTAAQVGLGNVTNNAQTLAAVVPNTAPGAGQILVGNSGGTAYAPQSVSGDCTLTAGGAITCTKTGGAVLAASATINTTNASNITSGTLPHAQLPALVSGDIPNNTANTSGNAATAGTATNVAGGVGGSIPYQSAAGTTAMLGGNTAASDQVLTSTGTGTAAQAPTLKNAPALSAANMTGFPNTVAGVSPAGSLASGDYAKANGSTTVTDSGVLAGPYAIPWITAVRGGGTVSFTQNTAMVWGVVLTFPLSTSQLTYKTTVDNTANLYDIGIYCAQSSCGSYSNGALVVDLGATAGTAFSSSATYFTKPWAQGTKTLQPGRYYIALTTNCSSACATITAGGSSGDITFISAGSAGSTSGGALGGTITPPADVWSWGSNLPALVVR